MSGQVLAIGGLRSKLFGAKAAGVKLVLFPHDNLDDYKKICRDCPSLFDDSFEASPVSTIQDVLPRVLVPDSSTPLSAIDSDKVSTKVSAKTTAMAKAPVTLKEIGIDCMGHISVSNPNMLGKRKRAPRPSTKGGSGSSSTSSCSSKECKGIRKQMTAAHSSFQHSRHGYNTRSSSHSHME